MYETYYGLLERPFELTPNPRFLYLSGHHREALSNLKYGLVSAKSLTLLLGQAGTGKTTLLKAALESEECRRVRCVSLNNPALTRSEFVEMLAARFELGADAARSKAVLLDELERSLRERRERGEITALVIDEAQSLSAELLEEVRLLANFETDTEKLLPLVLAGQPELGARLEDPHLQQLKQRVALRCEINAFDLGETASYIATRVATAGGNPAKLFTREAVTLIHQYSRGVPRTINVMCDNALVNGFALRQQPVDRKMVLEVCRDFCLVPPEEPAAVDVTHTVEQEPVAVPSEEQPVEREAASVALRELFRALRKPGRFAMFGSRYAIERRTDRV